GVEWECLTPNERYTWLPSENEEEFYSYTPIASKSAKAAKGADAQALFKTYSAGIKTNRDDFVYDFHSNRLKARMERFVDDYNLEVDRYKRAKKSVNVDDF